MQAAERVLERTGEPMNCREMVEAMAEQGNNGGSGPFLVCKLAHVSTNPGRTARRAKRNGYAQ